MCDQQTETINKIQDSYYIKSNNKLVLKKQFSKFRIENNILIGQEFPISREPINVSEEIFRILKNNPTCIGQIDAITEKEYTFADIMERSIKCALWLKKQGVMPGDIIGLCVDNNMDAIVILLGIMYIGAICNTWDHELSENTAHYFLSLTSPAIIFSLSISTVNIMKAAKQLNMDLKIVSIDKLEEGYECFEDILNKHDITEIAKFKCSPINSPDDTALIVLSSGTTGMPKATEISHGSLCNSIHFESTKDMRNHICAWTPTLRWQYGVNLSFNAFTACSTRIIIPDCALDNDVIQICDFLEKYNITWFGTDPCMLIKMIKINILEKYKLLALKKVMSSGSHLKRQHQEILAKKLPHVAIINSYGSTDFGGSSCYQNEYSKPGSVGFISFCNKLKVVDLDTEEILGPNQIGEIRFSGPRMMKRYYKNPEATKQAFDSNGWLRSGDLGYYDDDGEIFLVDRISEFILFRSINVSPAEIETILETHPAVDRAVVVGIHDEIDGQHPMAIVSLIPSKLIAEDELHDLVENNLPDHCKLRAGIKFVTEIPRTKTGKLARKKIRDMFVN